MKKDIKSYTYEQILERKNNLFGLNESALYRIGNTIKHDFTTNKNSMLSLYFHGRSDKKCYLKYSSIKKEAKNKKNINDYIFSVTYGEYPQYKAYYTTINKLEKEYQKSLEGKLSKIRKIPNFKFNYLHFFDYQDKEIDAKTISVYSTVGVDDKKYNLDVYEYNGDKYIRVYELNWFLPKSKKMLSNLETTIEPIWFKFEPVTWLVDRLTGIACTLNPMYMPFGTDEFIKCINQKTDNNYIETKNDRVKQILEEIRECLKEYKGDIDIYAKVNELLDNYNKKINELKNSQSSDISLSLTNEDTLYNELYLNLDNILNSLKFLIKDAEKYNNFLKTLKLEETESDIAKEIMHCRDNVNKYNYPELTKDFDKIIDDTIKTIENDISALSNILDFDKRTEYKLEDRIKDFEDKIAYFNGHILKYSNYFDFINLLRFNNKDNKLYNGLYDELYMLKEKIVPELMNVDITTEFYNLLSKYMKIAYASIPEQGQDVSILNNIVKNFRMELLNFELKIKVELSKRENNIDDYQNLFNRKKEVAETSISETYICAIDKLINDIEEKFKLVPYEIYEKQNENTININDNFKSIKKYYISNKDKLDYNQLKIVLIKLAKIDYTIDIELEKQNNLNGYIIK